MNFVPQVLASNREERAFGPLFNMDSLISEDSWSKSFLIMTLELAVTTSLPYGVCKLAEKYYSNEFPDNMVALAEELPSPAPLKL